MAHEQILENRLEVTGERLRLKALARDQLEKAGCFNAIDKMVQEMVASKGLNITLEDIINHVVPTVQANVPAAACENLAKEVKRSVEELAKM